MAFVPKGKLPRLAREYYQGRVSIFWTHTFENRDTRWLSHSFHCQFREVLIHVCGRFALGCPVYVLMPDHWHLVWLGLTDESDQQIASRFLRKHLREKLSPARLQDRAHDHVMRISSSHGQDAFSSACDYVRQNPVRSKLVETWAEWPFLGAVLPGYPELNPRAGLFWEDFWKIHARLVNRGTNVPRLPPRATP